MARVDVQEAPEVAARTEVPADYQHIEASPAAFGAGIGQGLSALGESGVDAVKFWGEVAADHSFNSVLQQGTAILSGDPSKVVVGPDGQPIPDTGFLGTRGADTGNARQATEAALDQVIQQQRAGLATPLAQHEFDEETKRQRALWAEKIGAHADEQSKVWALQTSENGISLTQGQIAGHLNDPGALAQDQQRLRDLYVKRDQAQLGNLDLPSKASAVQKADQTFYSTQVRAQMHTDPIAAKRNWEAHQDVLAGMPDALSVDREVRERAADAVVGTYSDPATVARGRAVVAGAPPQVGQSAGAPQAPRLSAAASAAFNIGNVKAADGTYARPATAQDGVILAANNLRDGYRGLTLAQIAEKWASRSDGNDPAAWARNVSRVSGIDTNTVPDLNSAQTLGALVRGIGVAEKRKSELSAFSPATISSGVAASLAGKHANFGVAPGTSEPSSDANGSDQAADPEEAYLDLVRTRARQVFTNPNDQNTVENIVKRVQFNIHRDDSAQIAQVEDHAKDSIAYLQSGGDPAKVTVTPNELRASIPGPRGEEVASALGTALDYNKASRQIATASDAQVNSILAGHVPTGPDDFMLKGASFAALQKAAQDRQAALYGNGTRPGDPAGYANRAFPDVGAAFSTALQSSDPAAFAAYTKKLAGAYGALGVPDAQREIIPRQVAASIVNTVQTKPPADALKALQALQNETGPSWSAVYRDLVRTGLPVGIQTPMIVAQSSPQDAKVMIAAMQRDADARTNQKPVMEEEAAGLSFNGKKVTNLIDTAIGADTGLASLRQTFGVAGRAGLEQFAGVQSVVKSTALYLYLTGAAHDPTTAAARAAKMVSGLYDFVQQPNHAPVRLPSGSAPDFRTASQSVLDGLKVGDVRAYASERDEQSHPLSIPEPERAQHALDGARHAYWVTVPGADGNGAVRAIDPRTGQPVLMARGGTLDIPFSRLRIVATQARARPRPAQVTGMPLG